MSSNSQGDLSTTGPPHDVVLRTAAAVAPARSSLRDELWSGEHRVPSSVTNDAGARVLGLSEEGMQLLAKYNIRAGPESVSTPAMAARSACDDKTGVFPAVRLGNWRTATAGEAMVALRDAGREQSLCMQRFGDTVHEWRSSRCAVMESQNLHGAQPQPQEPEPEPVPRPQKPEPRPRGQATDMPAQTPRFSTDLMGIRAEIERRARERESRDRETAQLQATVRALQADVDALRQVAQARACVEEAAVAAAQRAYDTLQAVLMTSRRLIATHESELSAIKRFQRSQYAHSHASTQTPVRPRATHGNEKDIDGNARRTCRVAGSDTDDRSGQGASSQTCESERAGSGKARRKAAACHGGGGQVAQGDSQVTLVLKDTLRELNLLKTSAGQERSAREDERLAHEQEVAELQQEMTALRAKLEENVHARAQADRYVAVLEEDRSRLSDEVKLGRSHTQNDQMRNAALAANEKAMRDQVAKQRGQMQQLSARCHALEEQLAQANADAQVAATAAAAEAERGSDGNGSVAAEMEAQVCVLSSRAVRCRLALQALASAIRKLLAGSPSFLLHVPCCASVPLVLTARP
jgi:hypothetical protein